MLPFLIGQGGHSPPPPPTPPHPPQRRSKNSYIPWFKHSFGSLAIVKGEPITKIWFFALLWVRSESSKMC